ncbi:MAG: hypothetical protein HDT18_00585 [Oscillibacter sp.]|nr:hypothetical protein [Oscillibacter sp.]
MIEQLFNEERLYGEPVFSQTTAQIIKVRETIRNKLDDAGKAQLGQLEALYIRQNNAIVKDVYAEGFSTAVKLLLEALER